MSVMQRAFFKSNTHKGIFKAIPDHIKASIHSKPLKRKGLVPYEKESVVQFSTG
jgi:hypothetical protein